MFILERMIDLIAPHNCISCGAEGSLLCKWCQPDACLAIPPRCYMCFAHNNDSSICKKCRNKTVLKHVWVTTEYDKVAKELVQTLKFGFKRQAASIMAQYMADITPILGDSTVVIPVPTATSRVRQRGFDHAGLIAKAFAGEKHLPMHNCLRRAGQTRQVGSKRDVRTSQLCSSFWVSTPHNIAKQDIILIDDVLTTGATLEAAAKALKRAGAKSVNAVVFAQAK